jgi:hypothetical protein
VEEQARPANHWFHFPLHIVGIAFCLYWYFYLPKSGKALLALGALVAIMMLMDMRPVHKGICVAIILGLVLTENRSLDRERNEFAAEQRKKETEAKGQFKETMDKTQAILETTQQVSKLTEENLEQITGGRSFAIVTPQVSGARFEFQPTQYFGPIQTVAML